MLRGVSGLPRLRGGPDRPHADMDRWKAAMRGVPALLRALSDGAAAGGARSESTNYGTSECKHLIRTHRCFRQIP